MITWFKRFLGIPVPDPQLVRRVEAGITLLNENMGPTWVNIIDLSRLNMMVGSNCILGQLRICDNPVYPSKPKWLANKNLAEHGFLLWTGLPESMDTNYNWNQLQRQWIKRITKLQKEYQ